MAETAPLPPSESIHQAGGGQPAVQDVTIKQIRTSTLQYLEKIYTTYASPTEKHWVKDSIIEFLHHVQADKVTDSSGDIATRDAVDFAGFLHYMTSSASNVLAPVVSDPLHLSWPLASYFISSSHNTYLTGNQLNSDSDADAYRSVLLRGCRCVEIDVWDGDKSDAETSDSSDSSDSSDDDETRELKSIRKKSRSEKIASKLPGSLASRFSKRLTGKNTADTGSKTETKEGDSIIGAPLQKTLSPQAIAVEPRVLHGYTLTKEVSFREVCEAIRENAFVVTDLPLIVSLEVHCSQEQQEAMVRIINEVWAGYLLPPPKEDAKFLPAPGDLRHKILVKVKYAPPDATTSAADVESEDRLPPGTASDPSSKTTTQQKVKKASKIIQALSALGVYTRGVSFKSLSQPEATMPTHIFSLSEGGVVEVHENEAAKLFEHNREYLMRTYPSGMRIGSSNLDPAPFWRKGIQIVALNWQKWDEGMMLNEGMFAGTGGYVLKPEGYRGRKPVIVDNEVKVAPPLPASETILHQTLDLSITVFAAQNLPLPEDDDKESRFKPYVKIELHAEPPHEEHLSVTGTAPGSTSTRAKEGEYKARTKTQRGIHPDFKAETLAVAQGVSGVVPELSFVRFLIKDDEIGRDDLAAWACIRLDRLRSGYRFVHLFDNEGRESDGVLLVKVDKKLA
ncbi:PLC-like phosphodiesterase [Daldinia caldariorum]|uniref:PLC-like phosphodiesterase n=1 Tax=Daldinia caldariorum TaxID=326644 RepID=UPI002008473B|nr:PLC-like phosphodiesterase [Daldinia caldariorum]KAI1472719.1 PLC-like phosphodiesterase [Daldinia caldariorum]